MKKTITENDFMEEVSKWETRRDHFTTEGWRSLYRYIDQIEEDTGIETELGIVALCCEFAEYDSALDAVKDYDGTLPENERDARIWLEERTTVIPVGDTGRFIIANF